MIPPSMTKTNTRLLASLRRNELLNIGEMDLLAKLHWKQLNDVEIASVITYTRQAWANGGSGTDPVVQPSAITAAR